MAGARLAPIPRPAVTRWWLAIGGDGSIYTTEIGKSYKLGRFPPTERVADR